MARHIYVHIPFCEAKCSYCSFYSVDDFTDSTSYFDALLRDIDSCEIIPDYNLDAVDTIYFGGGTPSSQEPKLIRSALEAIIHKFKIDPYEAEITIEVNPHSLTFAKAEYYFDSGFNRVSVGVQSLHDSTLQTLGRLHNREQAIEAINNLKKAGFKNISADLMEGIPGQTIDEILEDAAVLVDLGVNHVSMYSLSIEEGTKFEKLYPDLSEVVPEETERTMYHSLRRYLNSRGIHSYEISNCAMEGYESIHNSSYWEGYEYYAFGAGSHGYLNGIRFGHHRTVKEYIIDPSHIIVEEALSDDDKMDEYAMLSLRKTTGVDKKKFRDRFGVVFSNRYSESIKVCMDKGLIEETDNNIYLSSKGLDFANEVFREFI